jgi:hypothetical protein
MADIDDLASGVTDPEQYDRILFVATSSESAARRTRPTHSRPRRISPVITARALRAQNHLLCAAPQARKPVRRRPADRRLADTAFRRVGLEILGNTDAFLHGHVWPRYNWEPPDRIGYPVWLYPKENWTDPATALGPQHDMLRAAIKTQLARPGLPA